MAVVFVSPVGETTVLAFLPLFTGVRRKFGLFPFFPFRFQFSCKVTCVFSLWGGKKFFEAAVVGREVSPSP